MRNIQSLDGLRAISICLVIIGHIYNAVYPDPHYPFAIFGNGEVGVTIFFVISGYLITFLLLKEYDREGAISLKNFYVRRAFRILPPYYLYLAVICFVALIGFLPVTRTQAASAFLFLWDYFPKDKTYPLEHLWSLSVEEQFYILWPISLILCLRRGRETARRLALACILLAPLLRALTHFTDYSTQIDHMLHTRMDSLMFGCLAALAQGEPWFERLYNRLSNYVYPMIASVLVLLVSPILTHHFGGAYRYLFGCSIEGLCIVFTMVWLIRNPESLAGSALNWGPIKMVGVMSYSLYLWQTVFLHKENHTVFGRYPFNLGYICACAAFSYFLVERPALRLRERFVKRKQTLVLKLSEADGRALP